MSAQDCAALSSNPRDSQTEAQIEQGLPKSPGRRKFLGKVGGLTAAGFAAGALELGPLAKKARALGFGPGAPQAAAPNPALQQAPAQQSFAIRAQAAVRELQIPTPFQTTNGDEQRYHNFIGNFSKGLPHNSTGDVDPTAYQLLLGAAATGEPDAFENIPLGGNTKLVNPLAGLAFDLEGTDSHKFACPPPPAFASQQRADEMIELYWMALCRDVNFTDYATNPIAQAAASELSSLPAFGGPTIGGKVTAQTLFRGLTSADLIGPYISQLFITPFNYGQYVLNGQISTYLPNIDYPTNQTEWLACQNGQGPFGSNQTDPETRYFRNGRDIAAYVHTDQVCQAFYNAALRLYTLNAPVNPGNPYLKLTNQSGFTTFGEPHFVTLTSEAALRAMKAVWYAKWFVHRTLRPECFGGMVHLMNTGQASFPINSDVLNSHALAAVYTKQSSYFHPQVFPEGCPQHPSYTQAHACIAGACATILKAAFNGSVPFSFLAAGSIYESSEDGFSLIEYTGADASQLTVNGEIDKLCSNIAMARNFAGVHWRTDYSAGLKLGEAVALSVLKDQRSTYAEDFTGFVITTFDGQTITV